MRKVTIRIPTKALVRLGLISDRFFKHNESLELLTTFTAGESVSQIVLIKRRGVLPPNEEIERRRGELLDRYSLYGFEVLRRDEGSREVTALITRPVPEDLGSLLRELGSEVAPARPFLVEAEETMASFSASEEKLQTVHALLNSMEIPYEVKAVQTFKGVTTPLAELTDRQRGLLQLAYRLGYYETPSRISLSRIADLVGVSRAAVSKTLRRAQARLLATVIR